MPSTRQKLAAITEDRLVALKELKLLAQAASKGSTSHGAVDAYGNPVNKEWLLQKLTFLSDSAVKDSDKLTALNAIGKIINAFDDGLKGKSAERRAYSDLMSSLLETLMSNKPENINAEVIDEDSRTHLLIPSESE